MPRPNPWMEALAALVVAFLAIAALSLVGTRQRWMAKLDRPDSSATAPADSDPRDTLETSSGAVIRFGRAIRDSAFWFYPPVSAFSDTIYNPDDWLENERKAERIFRRMRQEEATPLRARGTLDGYMRWTIAGRLFYAIPAESVEVTP